MSEWVVLFSLIQIFRFFPFLLILVKIPAVVKGTLTAGEAIWMFIAYLILTQVEMRYIVQWSKKDGE